MQNHCSKSVPDFLVPVHKFCILVQDWKVGTWSIVFTSTDFGTAVDMLQYLDRRMPEELTLVQQNFNVSGNHLLN